MMTLEFVGMNEIVQRKCSMKTEELLRQKANNINTLGTNREVGEKTGEYVTEANGGHWRIWDPTSCLSDSKA